MKHFAVLTLAALLVLTTSVVGFAQRRADVDVTASPGNVTITGTLATSGGGQSLEGQAEIDATEQTYDESHCLDAFGHESGDLCE